MALRALTRIMHHGIVHEAGAILHLGGATRAHLLENGLAEEFEEQPQIEPSPDDVAISAATEAFPHRKRKG